MSSYVLYHIIVTLQRYSTCTYVYAYNVCIFIHEYKNMIKNVHVHYTKYVGVTFGREGFSHLVKLKRNRKFAINQKILGNFLQCGPHNDPVPASPQLKFARHAYVYSIVLIFCKIVFVVLYEYSSRL